MSKQILKVLKSERKMHLAHLKAIDSSIAKFGGTTVKRRRKSVGRKAAKAAPIAKVTRKTTDKKLSEAEQLREEIKAAKGKK